MEGAPEILRGSVTENMSCTPCNPGRKFTFAPFFLCFMLKYVADQLSISTLCGTQLEDRSTPNTPKERDSVEGETLKYELHQQVEFLSVPYPYSW